MIAENVRNVRQRIENACRRAGRSPDEVTLVAVTKAFSTEEIRQAVEAGVFDIAENYVQELRRKREALNDPRIRWHFIGHLQSNKVKFIAEWIHLIHSVDSVRLGREISSQASRLNRTIDCLVEVNTTGEKSKFGISGGEVVHVVKELNTLQNVRTLGLMTVGEFTPDPNDSRPAFRTLRELRERMKENGIGLTHLSMGMTNDFETAIEEGATIVRIGTAIFGERKKVQREALIQT